MSDAILLEGLRFFGYHGLYPEERTLGQRFLVDVEAELDLRDAGLHDELDETVNYQSLYTLVRSIVEGEPMMLIEAVADRIARSDPGVVSVGYGRPGHGAQARSDDSGGAARCDRRASSPGAGAHSGAADRNPGEAAISRTGEKPIVPHLHRLRTPGRLNTEHVCHIESAARSSHLVSGSDRPGTDVHRSDDL